MDGIVTGCILAVGRIVGESAVLMFTAGMGHAMIRTSSPGRRFLHSSGATLTVALYVYAKERADVRPGLLRGRWSCWSITLAINLAAKLVGKTS